MKWSPQQAAALKAVQRWYEGPDQVFNLSGYAGTGKTTLAKHFAEHVKGTALFCAFTGKAASVLRQMGCPTASTLHSLLYSVSERSQETLHEIEDKLVALPEHAEEERAALLKLLAEERREARQPYFSLNPDSPVQGASLVVLDESSMIDHFLARDLESFGRKILVMGDPAQLPPVKGLGYYSKMEPDILLTEIHRQARDNPILEYATLARNGKPIPFGTLGLARKISKDQARDEDVFVTGAQLIIGTNAKRRKLNQYVRRHLGHEGRYPRKGELLVVLRNHPDTGVLNGVQCYADDDALATEIDVGEENLIMPLKYEGRVIPDFVADPIPFQLYDTPTSDHSDLEYKMGGQDRRWMVPMDFGYALTAHKAQGSQWDRVIVCDDGFGWNDKKLKTQWLYTAITRARQELVVVA